VRRREFIAGLGSAAAWPAAVRAQQPAMPVVGFLSALSPGPNAQRLDAFRQGLNETGYIEGRNMAIEYRWAENQYDRLPAMAAELVRRQVAVLAALGSTPGALAAKAATTTIPIVFITGSDPVQLGLVASLNRPGGNVTGVTQLGVELVRKRLELLHETVPTATTIALLVNPANAQQTEEETREARDAARTLGLQLHILPVGTERELDTAFATLAQLRIGALMISSEAFFLNRSEQLAVLTVRFGVPTINAVREFATAGGLMSYATSSPDTWRIAGGYIGRILKGEKPANLPVQRSTKVELIINMKTAKALGLTIPETLLATADEVIQ
jgi:putative tryptophan/tyrosine transport system substrate-binding protein